MRAKTVEKMMKHSIVYGYAVTQPFAFYVSAQPLIQDKLLAEAEKLQYGENSEVVRHLQYKLNKLGYYEDAIDGIFGLLTEHAVKGFQSSYEINVTGQVDEETMKTLIRVEKQAEIDKIKSLLSDMDYGTMDENVRKVQEVLFYYGYYKGTVDGIYGPLTESAINQIIAEGYVDADSNEVESNVETVDAPAITAQVDSVESTKEEEVSEIIQLEVQTNHYSTIDTAKAYIGVPYVWGGTSPSGFDCSGFIQYVYAENDIVIPRTVSDIWNFSKPVDEASIGDLVFFETYKAGPSHLGIYLGNGDFIHAGSSNGVTISNLYDDSYWNSRYIGAKRIN